LSILSVLHNPIIEDALVSEIAEKFEKDQRDYRKIARLYTEEIALGIRPDTSNLLNHTSADS
jgi:ubiquitin-protein ligase